MKRAILVIALLGLLLCSGYGQSGQGQMQAKIPFDFTAAGNQLPAGTYIFEPTSNYDTVMIRNVDTRKTIIIPVLTRLGNGGAGDPRLTFDVIGEDRVLETMQPSADAGYLFSVAKEKHTHKVIKLG